MANEIADAFKEWLNENGKDIVHNSVNIESQVFGYLVENIQNVLSDAGVDVSESIASALDRYFGTEDGGRCIAAALTAAAEQLMETEHKSIERNLMGLEGKIALLSDRVADLEDQPKARTWSEFIFGS